MIGSIESTVAEARKESACPIRELNAVNAEFHDGVLRVIIPKAKARRGEAK